MKTFGQLTEQQQEMAKAKSLKILVESVAEGLVEIELTRKPNQLVLEQILSNARKNENYKLAVADILASVALVKEFLPIAEAAAQGAWYAEAGDIVMDSVA